MTNGAEMHRRFAVVTVLSALFLAGTALPAAAQTSTTERPHARPRIEVHPAPRLLYRRCVDWYEIQYRPSGTVLFPAKHCWWVRG
jgi:hypothetical protein